MVEKLNTAQNDPVCQAKWAQIGVNNANEMIDAIIDKMNSTFGKINIAGYETDDKNNIKDAVNNSGNVSKYLGYLKTDEGNIDGLFFYNEPQTSTGNDLMTRNIWPSLIGIYKNIADSMVDLNISSRPVYIVNINETTRMSNRGVKINIICAVLSGFNYVDMFDTPYLDVLPRVDYMLNDGTIIEIEGNPNTLLKSLDNYNTLFESNDYFEYDSNEKVMTVLSNRFESSNPSAEVYRFCPKIIPAAYIAKNQQYRIDVDQLDNVNGGNLDILKAYLRKFNEQ